MKIFLIGFMGCGKTTMAKKLATKLGYELVDLDLEIEKRVGQPIADYFAENGEEAFRKLESETLKTFNYPSNTVIATGGGAPCHFDNMEWMNKNGHTIYIKLSPLSLAKRLENGKTKRPLLKDLDQPGLIHFIENKLAARDRFYRQAKSIISGINLSSNDLRALVMAKG